MYQSLCKSINAEREVQVAVTLGNVMDIPFRVDGYDE